MKLTAPILACALALGCQDKAPVERPLSQGSGVPVTAAQTPPSAARPAWTPRPPAQIAEEGNHLVGSGSLYLRQHAHNPLEWYPWGEEALARARAEDKPIFLSIGYSSCHWCHVMEHEVFEQEDVAAFMNEHFVCIKVDREERPDLDAVYMDAVVAMTGRGGWPMTVFMTPELKPFFGGTYFPKKRFVALAKNVLERFRTQRDAVENDADKMYQQIATAPGIAPAEISPGVFARASQIAVSRADAQWGGLQARMKFPTTARWHGLLHVYRKTGDADLGGVVQKYLDMMASGGIYDHVGGGFHRYTVEPTWLIPHFEKMLYDNGQLASLYVEAAQVFADRPRYKAVALDVLSFLARDMREPGGAFYASFDADSGGHEGTFYVWSPAELSAVVGERDGQALALLLGVTDKGNFEGKNVLTRRVAPASVAEQVGRSVAEVAALWDTHREALAKARDKRVAPGLDKKIVTAWNGLAIDAFARAYAAWGDPNHRRVAEEAAEWLWKVHRAPGGGLYRASNQGKPTQVGILDDYAFLAVGLLRLFQATQDAAHLERARTLIAEADQRFAREGGGWYLSAAEQEAPLSRAFETMDSARPSGNSMMLRAKLMLAALTGSEDLFGSVEETLQAYARQLERASLGMGGWLDVALLEAGPYYEVVLAVDDGAPSEALRAVVRDLAAPWAVRVEVPIGGPGAALEKLLPPTFAKVGRDGGPLAYVCVRGSCNKPTADPAELKRQLLTGWSR